MFLGDADVTPRVAFAYDPAGNRTVMREYDNNQQIRTTSYQYDTARRLVGVGFDSDGDGDTDETVSYEYDLSGNRARLTLPGDLSISYRYDAKGQLVGLTDWDEQSSTFFYDKAGRHVGTQRPNGLLSEYRYNPAGHLRRIRHFVGSLSSLRAHFGFQVDGRGNRTRAYERIAEPTSISATYDKDAPEVDYSAGTWADDGVFKKSEQFSARLGISWTGDEGLLTMGTGPDHSIFDLYIGGSLWQSVDGYAPTAGERVIPIPVDDALEIRNRASRNIRSTGYVVRFKHLDVLEVTYDERTIQYTYDALSRLREANYNNGAEILTYGFDLAGNLTNNNGASRTYNAANQMTHDGTNSLTYDANGNMTSDGVNAYTWDRANRLLSMGGISYAYNGDGNRIQQDALQYILDLQPGLAQVIGDSDGNRYIHSPRGIHASQSPISTWSYIMQDGLGSVRSVADSNGSIVSTHNYTPIGVMDVPFEWAFTGEQRDYTGVQYHRARYYNPNIGIFPSLDPFEGMIGRLMSLNRYAWVDGNVINKTDASGFSPNCCHCDNVPGGRQDQCYIECLRSTPLPQPLPQPSCSGIQFDECDLRYLAHASAAEATGMSNAVVAAIILSQINYSKRPNSVGFYGFRTVEEYLEGNYSDITINDQVSETYTAFRNKCLAVGGAAIAPTLIPNYDVALRIARAMSCRDNPLGNFTFSEFDIRNADDQAKLRHIAATPTLSQERSFGGGVVAKLNELRVAGSNLYNILRQGQNYDWIDFTQDDPTFTSDYVIFNGINRSVVIYSYQRILGINPHLQCTQTVGAPFNYALKKMPAANAEDICAPCDSGSSVLHSNTSYFKRCQVQGICRGWYCRNGEIRDIQQDFPSNSGCAAIARQETGNCWG